MSKWFEEVKLCDPNHPDGAEALVCGFMKTSGYGRDGAEILVNILQTAWAEWGMDRLIAIVEGAEFGSRMCDDDPVPMCPICATFEEVPHLAACPYSDEYKGG